MQRLWWEEWVTMPQQGKRIKYRIERKLPVERNEVLLTSIQSLMLKKSRSPWPLGTWSPKRGEKEPQKWILITSLWRRGTQRSQEVSLDGSQEYLMNLKGSSGRFICLCYFYWSVLCCSYFFFNFFLQFQELMPPLQYFHPSFRIVRAGNKENGF